MPTLLIATEADEGMGHVAPWTGFVSEAILRGFAIHMAGPDAGLLHQTTDRLPVHIWSSPRLRNPHHAATDTPPPVHSWPELLVSLGYAHAPSLLGAVKAWRSILSRIRPTLVLADYAPALLLAAWTLDIPSFEVGNGFCIPPLAPRLQCFPGIKRPPAAALMQADTQLVQAYNECLLQFGKSRIATVGAVQAWPVARLVLSPPELDCYAPRTDVVHAGLLQSTPQEPNAEVAGDWPPVVGYLKASTPGLDALIDQMAQARIHALVYVAGARRGKHSERGTVRLTDQALPLPRALQHASVYLSNGGLSGVGQALQKGCWPVIVPQQAEQVATARNLLQRGWCGVWLPGIGNTSEQSTQALFAPRARYRRLGACDGESILFQTIGQWMASHADFA